MGGENENDLGFGEEEWRRTYDALLQFLKGLKRRKAADLDLSTADLLHDVLQRCFAQPSGAATVRERGFVARVFSQVVGDEVDRRRALKRGGDRQRITLSDHPLQGDGVDPAIDLERLTIALDALREDRPDAHRVVELKFFSDLTAAEAREHLGMDAAAFTRLWRYGRAFLRQRLARGEATT